MRKCYPIARYARHIRQWLDEATPVERAEGLTWYATAASACADLAAEYGLTHRVVAGVVAALSPQVRWDRNVAIARDVIRKHQGLEVSRYAGAGGAFPANVRKAQLILDGADPAAVCSGRKVEAFFALLSTYGAADAVCVDSIAILVALGIDPNPLVTTQDAGYVFNRPAQIEAISRAYRRVAQATGLLPCELQAIVWITYRNERDKT